MLTRRRRSLPSEGLSRRMAPEVPAWRSRGALVYFPTLPTGAVAVPAHHQGYRAAPRGVQATHQDPMCRAFGGNSGPLRRVDGWRILDQEPSKEPWLAMVA